VDIFSANINKPDSGKNLILLAIIALARCLNLYLLDQKNVACTGFPEEKILM
jgi:hypothetical protein